MQTELSPIDPSQQAKVKCFGNSAAMTVEAVPLISKGLQKGVTINLEVATKIGEKVNWDSKITVQLSEFELPIFASVCLGYLPRCEFKRPGKGIAIERQKGPKGKLYVSATMGKGNCPSLPVPIGQSTLISCLALSQLQKNTNLNDGSLLLAAIRGSAALYKP